MGGRRGVAAQRLSVSGPATPGSQRTDPSAGSRTRGADRAQPSALATGTDAAAHAAAHAAYADRDRVLADFAEAVVQLLVEMAVPGVQWLSLTEAPTPNEAPL